MSIQEFEIEFDPTVGQEFEIDIEDCVTEVFPDLINLEVTPTEEEQVFNHDGEYGYDEVRVNPIPEQYIVPAGELDIDRNGKHNIKEYESVNVLVEPVLQTKIVTPTKNVQVVKPDNEYYGLDKVNVNPIPDEYIIPVLQSKELDIKENGTYDIVPDKGITGLEKVSVTVDAIENLEEELNTYNNELVNQDINISDIIEALEGKAAGGGSEESDEYIQDGLIAWFDARDELVDGKWMSRIGDDYWYQSYPTNGTKMRDLKTADAIVNDGTFCIQNKKDYLLNDYTIEIVGKTSITSSADLLTFNKTNSIEININRYVEGQLSLFNSVGADDFQEKPYTNLIGKRCTFSINFLAIAARNILNYSPRFFYTLNGEKWNLYGFNVNDRSAGGLYISSNGSYKANTCCLLSYYHNQYPTAGEINSVRVYNRKLTDSEVKHNHKIDKRIFQMSELEG